MSGNAQKTPFARSITEFARIKIDDATQLIGKRLPCSVVEVDGAIVTVKFEVTTDFTLPQVKVPIANSLYAREPTQVGDLGWVQTADARIGGVSGLGIGTADLSPPANLGALVFEPIGNAGWEPSPNPDAYLLQGPDGVIIRDIGNNCSIVVDQETIVVTGKTQIKLQVGSGSITITDGAIDFEGTLTINGKAYMDHEHGGVTVGSGFSGGVHDP